jgi:hypothetical protein
LLFFRRYETELKKENKNEEYRELARKEIRLIEAALPILKYAVFFEKNCQIIISVLNRQEDEYKARLKTADDTQQAATNKRKVN